MPLLETRADGSQAANGESSLPETHPAGVKAENGQMPLPESSRDGAQCQTRKQTVAEPLSEEARTAGLREWLSALKPEERKTAYKRWLAKCLICKGCYSITKAGADSLAKELGVKAAYLFLGAMANMVENGTAKFTHRKMGLITESAAHAKKRKDALEKAHARLSGIANRGSSKALGLFENGTLLASWGNGKGTGKSMGIAAMRNFILFSGLDPRNIQRAEFDAYGLGSLVAYHKTIPQTLIMTGCIYARKESIGQAQARNFLSEKPHIWELYAHHTGLSVDEELVGAATLWVAHKTGKLDAPKTFEGKFNALKTLKRGDFRAAGLKRLLIGRGVGKLVQMACKIWEQAEEEAPAAQEAQP